MRFASPLRYRFAASAGRSRRSRRRIVGDCALAEERGADRRHPVCRLFRVTEIIPRRITHPLFVELKRTKASCVSTKDGVAMGKKQITKRFIGRWVAVLGSIIGGMALTVPTMPSRADETLPVAVAPTDAKLLYTGRADNRDATGPRFEWPASMVTVRFRGTDLQAKINETGDDYFEVVVDSAPPKTIHPPKGNSVVDLAHGLPKGTHEVRVIKRTEAFVGRVQFTGFALNQGGELLQASRPKHKIEVIGDSISCGYGNEGPNEKEHFRSETENAYLSYGAVAARAMDAEYVCVAWSGKKLWPNNTIPELYDRALPTDPASTWNFAQWTPDVVLINLATNDFGQGIPDADKWTAAYKTFVKRVRKNYPKATIYLASGSMMSDAWPPKIKALSTLKAYLDRIQSELKADGETKLRIIHFDAQNGAVDGLGSDYHPSVKTDAKMAAKFEAALQSDLGWKKRQGKPCNEYLPGRI